MSSQLAAAFQGAALLLRQAAMGLFGIPVQHGDDNICVLRVGRGQQPTAGAASFEFRGEAEGRTRMRAPFAAGPAGLMLRAETQMQSVRRR